MTAQRKQLLSVAMGTALLSAMLLLSSLHTTTGQSAGKITVLNDVHLYVPPSAPPPSPLQSRTRTSTSGGSLRIDISQKPVELGRMKLDTRFTDARAVPVVDGQNGIGLSGYGAGGRGNGGFDTLMGADQLDATPMVLSAPLMAYPERLVKNNVRKFTVAFQIMIDENGKAHPIRITQTPDPALDAFFNDYASQVVFTPPRHKGKPVKAKYLWSIGQSLPGNP